VSGVEEGAGEGEKQGIFTVHKNWGQIPIVLAGDHGFE
jgi:hypothetical protein